MWYRIVKLPAEWPFPWPDRVSGRSRKDKNFKSKYWVRNLLGTKHKKSWSLLLGRFSGSRTKGEKEEHLLGLSNELQWAGKGDPYH